MKNIHIIPTDKPSRFQKTKHDNFFLASKIELYTDCIAQHIYITSDEEIKDGWSYDRMMKSIGKRDNVYSSKIILTTDQDLIKDGVQCINDEFLEWFIKNPSCEEVKIESWQTKGEWDLDYKTIIPKEEPNKTHYLDELPNMDREVLAKMWESAMPKLEPKPEYSKIKEGLKKSIKGKEHFIQHFKNGGSVEDFKPLETLEEAKQRILDSNYMTKNDDDIFEMGAKWQQERNHSEEDMKSAWEDGRNGETECIGSYPFYKTVFKNKSFKEWFEQFKKK